MSKAAQGGTTVLLTGPFGEPERTITLDRTMTIAEIIDRFALTFRLPTIAVVDGLPVLRGAWHLRRISEDDLLAFVAIPGNGGGSGDGKQIIGLVAAIALAVAAPMIGGWVAGAMFGGSQIAAGLVTGLVLAGGQMLLNTLFPPPTATETQTDTVYSALAANNRATPYDVVPALYGELDFAPRFAARPYSEFSGNDQYLYQLFAVTLGKADILRVRIGETEAWNSDAGYSPSFSDLELEIIQPGADITLFPANVITAPEVANQPVPDPPDVLGPFVVNPAGTEVNRIAVDFAFPRGLFEYDDGGKIKSRSVSLRAQYQEIDDAGAPVGGWNNLFAETFNRATRTPQRISRSGAVPDGRYQVRFSSDVSFSSSDRVADDCIWAGLRGYLKGFSTPPNCTLLAVKIRANEQLSQMSANQVRVLAARHLDVWDPEEGEWVETRTRSIAWAAADILRNADYSLGLQDAQYDLAALLYLDAVWQARGDTFNALFDRSWTASDALRAVLRTGRAQPVRIGGKIGFTRLEPKQLKRAVFTPANVVRGTFAHELILFDEDKPDSVIAKYLDETVWDMRETRAALAAIGSDAPQAIEYFGITNHDQAWREAVTAAAINAYQREFVGFTSEWEGKLLVRGDPILIHHPFIEGVANARLWARNGAMLTLDRDIALNVEGEIYAIVRGRNGREWGPCLVSTVTGRELALDGEDLAAVEAQMGSLTSILPHDRDEAAHILICEGETRPFNGLVVSARPNGPHRVEILAVIDAPEVYLADGEEVMPSPWTPPTLPPAVPLRPVVLGLFAALRPGNPGMELDAMWQPAPGASRYVAEVSYDGEESWVEVYAGEANRFTVPVLPQVPTLRVAAVGTLQGPWVVREFVEGEMPDVRIPSEFLEGSVDLDALDRRLSSIVGTILSDREGSISSLIAALDDRLDEVAASVARLTADGQADAAEMRKSLRVVRGQSSAIYNLVVTTVANDMAAMASRIEQLGAHVGEVEAAFSSEISVLASELEAQVTWLTEVAARADDATAGGLIKWEASAGPGFGEVDLTMLARVTTAGTTKEMGIVGRVSSTGPSYMLHLADATYFWDGDTATRPVSIESGVLVFSEGRFESLKSLDGETIVFDGVSGSIVATGDFSFG